MTKNYHLCHLWERLVHLDKNPDKDADTAAKSALLHFYSLLCILHYILKFFSWKFQNLVLIILLNRLLGFIIIFQRLFNYTDSWNVMMWVLYMYSIYLNLLCSDVLILQLLITDTI